MNSIIKTWHQFTPLKKVIISLIITLCAYMIFAGMQQNKLYLALILWSIFAFCYIAMSWLVICMHNSEKIKKMASKNDGSKPFVFSMIALACFACFFLVLLLMISKEADFHSDYLLVINTVVAIFLSWALLHTTYIFHYAHEYYGKCANGDIKKGLDFPGDEEPDYLDFAYFSLCMGTTFQVSDVEITDKKIRHSAMWHGILSFFLNTIVVALSINLIAGLVN